MNEPKLERCPMTDAEIIHIFENSRLQSEHFTQEALIATYVAALKALRRTPLPDNKALTVESIARKYMDICGKDCGGDSSVGIPKCPFYEWPDIDDDGPRPGGCQLAQYRRPLEKGE